MIMDIDEHNGNIDKKGKFYKPAQRIRMNVKETRKKRVNLTNRDGEYDGAVVLCCDPLQGLSRRQVMKQSVTSNVILVTKLI